MTAVEFTNDIITIKRLSWTGKKDYDTIIVTDLKAYKYKGKYEDFVSFDSYQNGLNPQKFLFDDNNTFIVKVNDLIVTASGRKFIVKDATIQDPLDTFNMFWQCLCFEQV